jgi:hypothetical protein
VTQIIHLRCDRCGKDMAYKTDSPPRGREWAQCRAGWRTMDFCPDCWKAMLKLAEVEMVEEE